MSIYATLWSIKIQDPASSFMNPRWVEVTAQAVPSHIGSKEPGCGYEDGDPYADFLPPPIETVDGYNVHHRAVVFITNKTEKGTERNGQEYVNPLLVLTGQEYADIPFSQLYNILEEKIMSGSPITMEGVIKGQKVIGRADGTVTKETAEDYTDSNKLRLLASWFDKQHDEHPEWTSISVQDDLRRIADKLESLE